MVNSVTACRLVAALLLLASSVASAQMRITEWMYDGPGGEFIEFTNIGELPVSLAGWRYDDDSADFAQGFDLTGFGTVQPGESVLLVEADAEAFRAEWNLCSAQKIVGGYTNNLGRADQINLYDAAATLVDRLTYGDNRPPPFPQGTIRTQGRSGWAGPGAVSPDAIVDDVTAWVLAEAGDIEDSVASVGGAIGNPGRSSRATVSYTPCGLGGALRITEYMYQGADGEFIEFTNVGDAPVGVLGWSFSDSARVPGSQPLSAWALVQPGESVVLTESPAEAFRAAWGLCPGVKIIGGLSQNLGRADEINLYDNRADLVDRLTYGDQSFPGSIRTQGRSGWVDAAGLGGNDPFAWTLSALGDAEDSIASSGGDLGSPGRSTRALVDYDPCVGVPGGPRITLDPIWHGHSLDLPVNGIGSASAAIADPTDPLASRGLLLLLADDDHAADTLHVELASSNPQVLPVAQALLTGSGGQRRLRLFPVGIGQATVLVRATDPDGKVGTYALQLAVSAPAVDAAGSRFHTGASDASTAQAVDAGWMLVADDENQALRLYDRARSGLPVAAFDFTAQLGLTDLSGGVPREVDIESSARIGERIYWSGSQGNARGGEARPNTRRVFATDLSGSGEVASLAYAGRYDHLRNDLLAWDASNGHGLGADALGFVAGSQPGVLPTTPTGFNIEAMAAAPDGVTVYLGFRAPLPAPNRDRALVVPVRDFDALVTGATPGTLPPGSAQFGTPILLDLGGRALRAMARNGAGQYLLVAGPTGSESGTAPGDFRLFQWSGAPAQAPVDLGIDLTKRLAGGSFEGIVEVPAPFLAGSPVHLVVDNGDFAFYGDGIAAKDLAEKRWAKFRTERVVVDPELIFGSGLE
ncbi:MAG: lamin tail domain-containing protein [Xanthomonadales bacterium]|nr:lamin tail domain-containing protein [Xanthomonadales bacterium]